MKLEYPFNKIKSSKVRNVIIDYSDHLDKDGHVSVTEWCNGEGFDISVDSGKSGSGGCNESIRLTHSQIGCINRALKELG